MDAAPISLPSSAWSVVFGFRGSDAIYRSNGRCFSSLDEVFSFANQLGASMVSLSDGWRSHVYFFDE